MNSIYIYIYILLLVSSNASLLRGAAPSPWSELTDTVWYRKGCGVWEASFGEHSAEYTESSRKCTFHGKTLLDVGLEEILAVKNFKNFMELKSKKFRSFSEYY